MLRTPRGTLKLHFRSADAANLINSSGVASAGADFDLLASAEYVIPFYFFSTYSAYIIIIKNY